MKRIFLLCLIAPILFTACKKDRDAVTRAAFLTYKSWYIKEANVTATVNGETYSRSLLEYMEPCVKDNATSFRGNGTVWIDEGMSKCDPSALQQMQAGTWKLIENDTKLRGGISEFPVNVDMEIVVLNEQLMKLRWQDNIMGVSGIFEVTYSHVN